MINRLAKIMLLIALATQQHSFSYDISVRDMYIGAGAVTSGIIAGLVIAAQYHPASLEKAKLEHEQAEKRKKELAEQAEKDKQHATELKKMHAANLLLQIKHTYAEEFKKLDKLHEKDNLLTIIKESCGMRDMPLNQYYSLASTTIESLKGIELVLPAEKQQERLILITNLERILKVYNTQIADKAKAEKDEAENKRRKEEAEQRKIEKEQLELKKLRLEVDNIKETRNALELVNQKLDMINTKVSVSDIREAEHAQEILGSVNALRIKQARDYEELKKILGQINQGTEKHFAVLFQLIESIIQRLTPQPTPQPTYQHYPAPTPSAPPMGA